MFNNIKKKQFKTKQWGSKRRRRLFYAKTKKASIVAGTTTKVNEARIIPRIKLPPMPYDDVLEVSRLTEELLMGHDISHFDSPSRVAKSYVQKFSKKNRGNKATEVMYNKVNKKLVKMNRGSVHLTDNSIKLYRALMDEDSEE